MAKLRRAHVVPAGYQRNFSVAGQQIRVIDKAMSTSRVVGVRDNFVDRHFLRVIVDGELSDSAEDEFARIERLALPLIREVSRFARRSADQLLAIKATMAMLWSRSFAHEQVAQRIHREVVDEYRRITPDDPRALDLFQRWHDRSAGPGELAAIVEESAAKIRGERVHNVRTMLQHHNDALLKFEPFHVSIYQPIRGCEFVTSDNPVLLAHTNHLIQVGAHNRLALGDAGFIFLPISRFVGACLTREDEGDLELDRLTVIRLNQAMWRNAVSRVACHPTLEGWRSACNV